MQKREKEVKSKGVFVGTAHFEEFDSVEEAVSYLGEDTVLSLINTQHGTNARNRVRAGVAGNLTKSALKDAAMAIIFNDQALIDRVKGNPTELAKVVEELSAQIKAEHEAKQAAAAAAHAEKVEEAADTSEGEDDE